MKHAIIVSTDASRYFAELIASHLGDRAELIDVESFRFGNVADGELYLRYVIPNRTYLLEKDVVIVGSSHTDEAEETLYRLGRAAVGYGARRLIVINPFFGYSTMERAVKLGEVVTAKTSACKFSSIPQAKQGNYFFFIDLHVSGLVHYFEGDCTRAELYAGDDLIKAIAELDLSQAVFGTADLGRPKWVESFADHFGGAPLAFIRKRRNQENTEVANVIGEVQGVNVIIYDDMTRSGNTLIHAADAYLAAGAREVNAVLTHAAFTKPEIILMLDQSAIAKIIITNTHPMSQHRWVQQSKKFTVVDVSHVFADIVKQILD